MPIVWPTQLSAGIQHRVQHSCPQRELTVIKGQGNYTMESPAAIWNCESIRPRGPARLAPSLYHSYTR